jgi:hypothetical protein
MWIGNVYGVTTQNGITAPVIVSADGQLGTLPSSERFKKDIATMDKLLVFWNGARVGIGTDGQYLSQAVNSRMEAIVGLPAPRPCRRSVA